MVFNHPPQGDNQGKGGPKMKYKRLIVNFWVSVMILSGVAQIAAESQSDGHLKKYYEACIAEKIAKCQSKTDMEKSRSKNLRLDAAMAAEKVRFLSLNMDLLVEQMVEQNVGKKFYKIDFFLNKKFFDDNRRLLKND
jgi:predicted phage tail protein